MTPCTRHRPAHTIIQAVLAAAVALLLAGCASRTARALRSVVRISQAGGGGTGIVVGHKDGWHLVLTARHCVIRPPQGIRITHRPPCASQPMPLPVEVCMPIRLDAFGPDETAGARLVKNSAALDLALLRVKFKVKRPALSIDPRGPGVGRRIVFVGCPAGMRPWWFYGHTIGERPRWFKPYMYAVAVTSSPGCSGGPVVDVETGRLVGVFVGTLLRQAGPMARVQIGGVGAMVPSDKVWQWLTK